MTLPPAFVASSGDASNTPRVREAAAPLLGLSLDQAAASLSVSRDFFDEHIRPGLRVVRLGRRVIVPVRELERWLAANVSLAVGEER